MRNRRVLIDEIRETHQAHYMRGVLQVTVNTRGKKRSLAFLTDIITPYTIAVMGELAGLSDLTVLFAAAGSGRGQDWRFSDLPFNNVVVGGLARRRAQADLSDYYFSPRILVELMRCAPEAIIAAGWSFPTYYAALYARSHRRALIIHSDGNAQTEEGLGRLQRLSRRLLVPCADGFAANTLRSAARFRELGARPDQLHFTPHSTELAQFWEVQRTHGLQRSKLRVLGVGRLLGRKGFDRLVAAFADASAENPDLELRLVGSGPEHDRLASEVRHLRLDSVELAGFVDQPALADEYAHGDIFVFPSLKEEFGFVLLEAMAAGLPCIASAHAGATHDLIRDGENGLVVDPDDREALAAAIVSLARDPDARRTMGDQARRDSRGRTPLVTAESYLAAVEATLRGRDKRQPASTPEPYRAMHM